MALPFIATAGPVASIGTLLQSSLRLEREQWLPPEELASRRLTRLRQILAKAANTSYYGAALRDARIDPAKAELHDLERLPVLDRVVIGKHGHRAFMTVDKSGLVQVRTSGSTGTPGTFFRSRLEEADYSARWWRVYAAYGCSMWDSQVNVAILDKPDRAGPITLLRRVGFLPRVEKVASDAPPARVLERVRAMNAPILTGYAGAIEALADHVLTSGARIHPPRAVFCTAMEVTDRCLQLAEQAFQAPAVDVYVTNEFGVLAWSCPMRRDVLHMNDDGFVFEVLGRDGNPVPQGTLGELVITSFGLTAMPLIRYNMGDMAAIVPERCECGRGLGLITRVHGRSAHIIHRRDGAPLTTPFVTSLLGRADAHEWVRRFQVREEPGRQLRFLINVRRPPSEAQQTRLTKSVELGMGQDFRIVFEMVDRIPDAPNGKLQYIVPLAS
jgi:phenylacetate-CoA ligase